MLTYRNPWGIKYAIWSKEYTGQKEGNGVDKERKTPGGSGVQTHKFYAVIWTDVLDLHYLPVQCHVWKVLTLSQFLFLFPWGSFSSMYPYRDHPLLNSCWELEEPNIDTLRAGLLNSDSLLWPLSGVWALGVQIYWSLFLYIYIAQLLK